MLRRNFLKLISSLPLTGLLLGGEEQPVKKEIAMDVADGESPTAFTLWIKSDALSEYSATITYYGITQDGTLQTIQTIKPCDYYEDYPFHAFNWRPEGK